MLNSGAEIRSELAHGTRSIPQSGQIHALDHRLKGGTYDAAIFGIARLDRPWFLEATLAPGPVRSTIESRNGEPSWHMRSAMAPGPRWNAELALQFSIRAGAPQSRNPV